MLVGVFAKQKKIKFIHISTDCVFDGIYGNYTENLNLMLMIIMGRQKL